MVGTVIENECVIENESQEIEMESEFLLIQLNGNETNGWSFVGLVETFQMKHQTSKLDKPYRFTFVEWLLAPTDGDQSTTPVTTFAYHAIQLHCPTDKPNT